MDTQTLGHFIGGNWTKSGDALASINPSDTGDIVARFADGGAQEIDQAVDAAQQALHGWSTVSPEARADLLHGVSEKLFQRSAELGELLAREEGKTRAEGVGETLRAARVFRYFAGEAIRRHGLTLDSSRPGLDVATYREPVGVIGLITPWNFPIAIPAWKAAPALAFGNTVVLKPSEIAPAMANALAQIFDECGAPTGIFNVVHGSGAAGRALVSHEGIAGVSFTGSRSTGAKVGSAAMATQKRVQMEMGGKNPLVILADADIDKAVSIAADGGFFQTGQRCTASSRVIVEDAIHDQFVDALAKRAEGINVGPALADGTQVGPVASEGQLQKNFDYIDIAQQEGGKLASGGSPVKCDTEGYYMAPTVIAETVPDMRINQEEVFGPVVSTIRVSDFDEAMAVANGGDFGLSAGIVSNDAARIRQFRRTIKAGMVMVNLPTAGVDYHVPFGGTRGSSYGPREQGFTAVEFYTQIKTVYTGD